MLIWFASHVKLHYCTNSIIHYKVVKESLKAAMKEQTPTSWFRLAGITLPTLPNTKAHVNIFFFIHFFYWIFSLFTFQVLCTFLVPSPTKCLCHPPPPSSMRVFLYPPNHFHLPPSISLQWDIYWVFIGLRKDLSSHWCLTSPSSATYAAGAMCTPCLIVYSLEALGVWLVDIVLLPIGWQTPWTHSVLSLTPLLGTPCSHQSVAVSICPCMCKQWLAASIHLCICKLWLGLSADSNIRLLSACTFWNAQYRLGFITLNGMNHQMGQSLDGLFSIFAPVSILFPF